MRTRKYILSILFAALSCAATSVLATPDQKCDERVLLTGLVANPNAYHGKTLWVVAYVTIEFENMTACPSEKDAHAKKLCLA